MKALIPVCILMMSLLTTACAAPAELYANAGGIDPTTDACHIDQQACATLTAALRLSPAIAIPTFPRLVFPELPGPAYTPYFDCSQVIHLAPGSLEAQSIVQQFLDNFHEESPTEYMEFELVWSVERLGEYAVIQGRVTDEENDLIVVQETGRGFAMLERHTSHELLSGFPPADISGLLAKEMPGVPSGLFYCTDLSPFLGDAALQEPSLVTPPSPDTTPITTISPAVFPTTGPEKDILIRYASYPGDGGGCMADYLGLMAPSFILYADGQLLVENAHADPSWYTEYQLDQETITNLLTRIETTGFFSMAGDGSEYEHDPIYQIPPGVEVTHGAGTFSLEVHFGDLSKRVTIYIPYADYQAPEITNALEVINTFELENASPYRPNLWVVWSGTPDPCEPYLLDFLPWPEALPEITGFSPGSQEVQVVLESTAILDLSEILGSRPGTYFYVDDGTKYYVYTRPLLPGETPSDF